jgi:hypothetical protein
MGISSIIGDAITDYDSMKLTLEIDFVAAAAASAIGGGVSAASVVGPAIPMALPKVVMGIVNTAAPKQQILSM